MIGVMKKDNAGVLTLCRDIAVVFLRTIFLGSIFSKFQSMV